MEKVSIIIPVYNAPKQLKKCLDSLLSSVAADDNYEILIIDDCSDTETVELLKSYRLPVIHNDQNLGFIKTSNRGFGIATGEIIVLLNSDTVVPSRFLSRIRDVFRSCPDCAFASPLGGNNEIRRESDVSFEDLDHFIDSRWDHIYHKTCVAHGFCLCVRASVIHAIGGFDEIYGKGYYEEQDICIKALSSGYANYVISNMYVAHYHSASFGSQTRLALLQQNKSIFEQRWHKLIKSYKRSHNLFNLKRFLISLFPTEDARKIRLILFLKKICHFLHLQRFVHFFNERYEKLTTIRKVLL